MKKLAALPFVEQTDTGEFWAIGVKVGPFRTHEIAWRWIDKHTDLGRADDDQYNKICIAFSKMRCAVEFPLSAGIHRERPAAKQRRG